MDNTTNKRIVDAQPPLPPLDRGMAIAHVLAAIPLILWEALLLLLFAFIALAVWFNQHNLESFVSSVLLWIIRLLIALGVVLLAVALYKMYRIYHQAMLDVYSRQVAKAAAQRQQLAVRKAQLQNEQLEVKLDLERQLPLIVRYALESGHNIEYDGKGLRVHNYLSNIHTLSPGNAPGALPGDGLAQLTAAPVQTFRQLLEAGTIGAAIHDGRMVLGYAGGTELRYGTFLDLYSCGIGGVSGSGKTTTVRCLLFQAILMHSSLVMVDPHLHEPEESLAAQFKMFKSVHALPPCDDKPPEVGKRVRWLTHEYVRRKTQGIKGPPLIFVLDEFNALVRHLPNDVREELATLMLNIAQEGRKFGIFAMVIAQRWSEQDLGGKHYGAAIRGSLASTLAHRFQDEEQAKKLAGSREGARCLELPQGHYLFRDTQGAIVEMITPRTESEDGTYIQSLLDRATSAGASSPDVATSARSSVLTDPPQLTIVDAGPERELDAGPDVPTPYQIDRVTALLKERKGQNEIIQAVWGFTSKDGRPYRTAVDQYRNILAAIVRERGA